jgi:hypothetical protein
MPPQCVNIRRRDQPVSEVNMTKRKTKTQFIQESRQIHGEKYDYSLVEYVNSKTKVAIICPEHGQFYQVPPSHLEGAGCPSCGTIKTNLANSHVKDQFIDLARKVHGEKYDYSLTEYKNSTTKIKIICPKHGQFFQLPPNHLSGRNCRKCGQEIINKKNALTVDEFLEKAKKGHGEKYDYSLVEYVNSNTQVTILCPEHGKFEQRPIHHLRKAGCPECGNIRIGLSNRHDQNQFIDSAKKVHGEKYDYSLAEYTGARNKIKIICPEHGQFCQSPQNHLAGRGCPRCGKKECDKKNTLTLEEFREKAKIVHGEKYGYSLTEYTASRKAITIICPEHGEFKQQPTHHLRGSGCPKCVKYGFNPTIPSTLYFLKFKKDFAIFWKIGITNRSIEKRFGSDANRITESYQWFFDIGEDAFSIEQKVLTKFAKYKFELPLFSLLRRDGDTECFNPSIPFRSVIKFIESEVTRQKDFS